MQVIGSLEQDQDEDEIFIEEDEEFEEDEYDQYDGKNTRILHSTTTHQE